MKKEVQATWPSVPVWSNSPVWPKGKSACGVCLWPEPQSRFANVEKPRLCEMHSRARGVVVSHPLSMREALGSLPSVSIRGTRLYHSATAASRPPLCLNNPACCWPPHCGAQSRIASCCEKHFRPHGPACQSGASLQSGPKVKAHAASVYGPNPSRALRMWKNQGYVQCAQGHVV